MKASLPSFALLLLAIVMAHTAAARAFCDPFCGMSCHFKDDKDTCLTRCGCGEVVDEVKDYVTCLNDCRLNCYDLVGSDREKEICVVECGCTCNSGCVERCDEEGKGKLCKLTCGCIDIPEPEPQPEPQPEPEPVDPEPQPEPKPEPEPVDPEPKPEPEPVDPEPQPEPEPVDPEPVEPEPVEPEPVEPEPVEPEPVEPEPVKPEPVEPEPVEPEPAEPEPEEPAPAPADEEAAPIEKTESEAFLRFQSIVKQGLTCNNQECLVQCYNAFVTSISDVLECAEKCDCSPAVQEEAPAATEVTEVTEVTAVAATATEEVAAVEESQTETTEAAETKQEAEVVVEEEKQCDLKCRRTCLRQSMTNEELSTCAVECGCTGKSSVKSKSQSLLVELASMNTKGTQAAPQKKSSVGVIAFWVIVLVLGLLALGAWWGNRKYYELRKKHGEKFCFFDDENEAYERLN